MSNLGSYCCAPEWSEFNTTLLIPDNQKSSEVYFFNIVLFVLFSVCIISSEQCCCSGSDLTLSSIQHSEAVWMDSSSVDTINIVKTLSLPFVAHLCSLEMAKKMN